MSDKTKIEWTDATWSPVMGCTPISEGCTNCFARAMIKRFAGRKGWPSDPGKVTLFPERFDWPLRLTGHKHIFIPSMGDLFHEDVPVETIIYLFEVMAACPQHTFQCLTKRPERMASVLFGQEGRFFLGGGDYYPNIWMGVSAENQDAADERIPILLNTWVGTTFVSIEPLLGPIDLIRWLPHKVEMNTRGLFPEGTYPVEVFDYPEGGILDWVIVGAETGPGARPMDPDWARDIRDQCQAAGVPFFFKKMSGNEPIPADLLIREMPKR